MAFEKSARRRLGWILLTVVIAGQWVAVGALAYSSWMREARTEAKIAEMGQALLSLNTEMVERMDADRELSVASADALCGIAEYLLFENEDYGLMLLGDRVIYSDEEQATWNRLRLLWCGQ